MMVMMMKKLLCLLEKDSKKGEITVAHLVTEELIVIGNFQIIKTRRVHVDMEIQMIDLRRRSLMEHVIAVLYRGIVEQIILSNRGMRKIKMEMKQQMQL
jgi:hypothetical protein